MHSPIDIKTSSAMELRSLRFRYDRSGPWLIDIEHFALPEKEQRVLTGPSGCGKSTLLQLIAGLLDPTEGSVAIAGKDLATARGAARDRIRGTSIGMVFQTFNLLQGFSAVENVMTAMMFSPIPRKEHLKRAHELLRSLGIDRPEAKADQLSIGQQQRVAVARAVACEPALVLADEPTASLDPANAEAAIELIRTTCEKHGAALLCVSHDPRVAERFEHTTDLAELRPAAGSKTRGDG